MIRLAVFVSCLVRVVSASQLCSSFGGSLSVNLASFRNESVMRCRLFLIVALCVFLLPVLMCRLLIC